MSVVFITIAFLPGLCFCLYGADVSCSASKNHLDPSSHKFISECSPQTFCSAPENGTCTPRLCRRDEFPFGYSAQDSIPPLCSPGTFCPDEGDGCHPLTSVGGACQLNRDEQCETPYDWVDLASTQNLNGAICLHSICMFSNATYGAACISENTTYVDTGFDSQQLSYTVIRDNCRPQLYCDQSSLTCQWTKVLDSPCLYDQECESRTCSDWTCVEPPENPFRIAPWQYAITTVCILGAMIATCLMLTILHKRHRFQRYRELCEYYHEQLALRRTLATLHSSVVSHDLDKGSRYQ